MLDDLKLADIEVLDSSVNSDCHAEMIQDIIRSGFRALEHGERFTGKPGTLIFEQNGKIVKVHAGVCLAEPQARHRGEFSSKNERKLGIYHPSKTWFVAKFRNRCWLGNITKTLYPLHISLLSADSSGASQLLDQYFSIYIRFMKDHEQTLDPGLSNFGADEDGKVFYLDDDIYGWDGFAGLSQAIGVWFRQFFEFPEVFFSSLGASLGNWLDYCYPDSEWIDIIAEQIRGVFTANEEQSARRDHFLKGFAQVTRENTGAENAAPSVYVISAEAPHIMDRGTGLVAILADIHANLPALEKTLAELGRRSISRVLILGDLVGYGPHPSECIELLRAGDFHIIRGNHDHATAIGKAGQGFSAGSRWVIDWTVSRLSSAERQWLGSLPLYLDGEDWLAVHGAPQDPTFMNGYVYRMTYEDNLQNMKERGIRYCFHGHTHIAGVYYARKTLTGHSVSGSYPLASVDQGLVCPGSVGQPRGGRTGLEFAILDTETFEIEFINLDYDVSAVIDEMNRKGFPSQLSSRLLNGR
ncbi:metallophosphoesterase family protein [Marinobacter sp.]|uniref:metallophosphoesterase family protein n=1 Tax=Marinobacter sp. TaxID=50741 RepID=UPI003564D8CE